MFCTKMSRKLCSRSVRPRNGFFHLACYIYLFGTPQVWQQDKVSDKKINIPASSPLRCLATIRRPMAVPPASSTSADITAVFIFHLFPTVKPSTTSCSFTVFVCRTPNLVCSRGVICSCQTRDRVNQAYTKLNKSRLNSSAKSLSSSSAVIV